MGDGQRQWLRREVLAEAREGEADSRTNLTSMDPEKMQGLFQISEVYGLSNSKTTETLSLDIDDKARRKLRGEWACEKGRCHCGTLPGLKQRKVWGARQKRIDCKGTDRNSSYTDASVGLMQRGRTSQNKLPFRQCPMGCYTETLSGIHGTIEAFGSPCVPLDFF